VLDDLLRRLLLAKWSCRIAPGALNGGRAFSLVPMTAAPNCEFARAPLPCDLPSWATIKSQARPSDKTAVSPMTKMSSAELKAMLAAERADALAAMSASKLSAERADALDYYYGRMAREMPAADGRSHVVSTDVADTIEGLMPQLMDIFCGGDEVVRFNPVGPEDAQAAAQETDYVNHVFMQRNPGFLVLYSFIKDALLSKVGIVKVWWEKKEEETRETYYDLSDDVYAILAADPSIEIIAHTERQANAGADPTPA
jgi:hypothetical protein